MTDGLVEHYAGLDKDIRGAFNTEHQPSKHAYDKLREVSNAGSDGIPAQEVNFTVKNKLLAFGFISLRDGPSHHVYSTHRVGQTVPFMHVTDKGREALRNR